MNFNYLKRPKNSLMNQFSQKIFFQVVFKHDAEHFENVNWGFMGVLGSFGQQNVIFLRFTLIKRLQKVTDKANFSKKISGWSVE